MPRTARAIVGSYCYHLINRGNNREHIFHRRANYAAFLQLIAEAQQRLRLPILAGCLMPNHLHLVVRPVQDADLSRWTHWLFTTHVRRHHREYNSTGRLWQGRFKAFVIQQDQHLLTVLRYVERNALRASLVSRAEEWEWGSLHWRLSAHPAVQLAPSPIPLPATWVEYVNESQTAAELHEVRTCVNRQRPFGSVAWVELKVLELGMSHSIAPVGRPRKR